MNYLQLCQAFTREVGLASSGPTTVVGQTGQFGRVVNWISAAWLEIQAMRDDWRFLWIEDSFPTIASTTTYDRTTGSPYLSKPDKETFSIYLTATGTSVRQPLLWEDYGKFNQRKRSAPASDAKPTSITQRPDNSLEVYPGPDAVYTIGYEGVRDAETLSVADASTPLLKAKYHMAIVYHAILLSYARYEENEAAVGPAKIEFGMLYEQMIRTETLRSDNDEIIVAPDGAGSH